MLDIVKEEFRNSIEEKYQAIMILLDTDKVYEDSGHTHDLELSRMGYRELITQLYKGNCSIGSLQTKKVWGSHYEEEKILKYRKVVITIVDDRIQYLYEPIHSEGHGDNRREGQLKFIEIGEKESLWERNTNRDFVMYPPIKTNIIDMVDELIELCFKGKNRSKLKELSYDHEQPIQDVMKNHLVRTVRDRKINSVLC